MIEEREFLWGINLATACVGCLSSYLVLLLHFIFHHVKVYYATWMGFLAASCFGGTVNTIIFLSYLPDPESHQCEFHGFVVQLTTTGVYLWNFVLSFFIWYYHLVLFADDDPDPRNISILLKFVPHIHCVVWVLCLFLSVVPYFLGAYGDAGIWCWIKTEWVRWAFFYAPLWLCFLGILFFALSILYIHYSRRARRRSRDPDFIPLNPGNNNTRETGYMTIIYRTGYLFVVSYIVTWTFPSLNRLLHDDSGHLTWLDACHVTSENMAGLWLFLIYLYTMYLMSTNETIESRREEEEEGTEV